ncbi:hypothetical protein RJT34_09897 [Clitoria ternatea]|uniref:Uncharacterized protein n=1 Tax=Clitoria ternatea TaxID=43366 RepID=A0AAN9K9E0_CLITE
MREEQRLAHNASVRTLSPSVRARAHGADMDGLGDAHAACERAEHAGAGSLIAEHPRWLRVSLSLYFPNKFYTHSPLNILKQHNPSLSNFTYTQNNYDPFRELVSAHLRLSLVGQSGEIPIQKACF